MHQTRPAKVTSPVVTLNGGHLKSIPLALIVAAVGIGASLLLSMSTELGLQRFMHSYLTAYCFVLSIGVGCLFFVTIMHLTRAGWSVTLRRIANYYAMCLPLMFVLFLPILIPVLGGSDQVYTWNVGGWSIHGGTEAADAEIAAMANAEVAARPPIEQLKAAYLNRGFFSIRIAIYFLVWGGMAWYFLRNSLKQDETGDKSLTSKSQAMAAPFTILFAASVVFASFDLEMSLSPLWFSTMFPVYFFAGAFLSALCTLLLTGLYLQRSGRITDEITIDHYHDLGKLMQGFVIFWGYIAFSQFLLIWYANVPEETFWYHLRFDPDNGWRTASILLLVGHLFIPFFLLMGRGLRRNRALLAGSAIFILCLHWFDHYWLVMPQLDPHGTKFTVNPMGLAIDFACAIGMIAMLIAGFSLVAQNRPLVPLKDPRLGEALNHEVH